MKIKIHYVCYPLLLALLAGQTLLLAVQTIRLNRVEEKHQSKELAAQKIFFRCAQLLPQCQFNNPVAERIISHGCITPEAVDKLEEDYGKFIGQ
jgi:hypothetical protein